MHSNENLTVVVTAAKARPRISHHGRLMLGDLSLECAVLTDGRRGFVLRQTMQAIGFSEKNPSNRFAAFCGKIGAIQLNLNGESDPPFIDCDMPHYGRQAMWMPYELLHRVIVCGARAWRNGELTAQQAHIGERCQELADTLVGVGVAALIDEATGYQYVREPDALQRIFDRFLRDEAADWSEKFSKEFYATISKALNLPYDGKRPPGGRAGQITLRWVYQVIMPQECIDEIKSRKRPGEKCHQWLKDGGLDKLRKQQSEVMAIARCSVDARDFIARCTQAFDRPGQHIKIVFPQAA